MATKCSFSIEGLLGLPSTTNVSEKHHSVSKLVRRKRHLSGGDSAAESDKESVSSDGEYTTNVH